MSELEEKLEGILGNPQAMAQIMSLAQSLNLGGASSPAEGEAQQGTTPPADHESVSSAPPPEATASSPPSFADSLSGLMGGLNSLDPKMLSAAASLMGQFNSGNDDKRVALLNALRPFVREERYAKLDQAVQIAKLSRLIRSGLELFRHRGEEDSHV